jgi:hypothetical protein
LSDELALALPGENGQDVEGRLTSLVLNGATSANSRRAYAAGLRQFFAWARRLAPRPFSKALVQEYRTWLNSQEQTRPLRARAAPCGDIGFVVEVRDHDLVAGLEDAADREAEQAEERGGIHPERNLVRVSRVDQRGDALAGACDD